MFCLVVSFCIIILNALNSKDFLINNLPSYNGSFNSLTFNQYSGYIPLNDYDDTYLFFWFVTSQNSPLNDPIILWNNGGPGASSINDGFWIEHGPFRLTINATYVNNFNYSWNKIANIIYLESPSGTGFSFSNNPSGYNCSDNKTAYINYLFLNEFFNIFSEYKSNHLYLVGESYAGHYTTQLAQYILDSGNNELINQIKGIAIGNGRTDNNGHSGPNEYAYLTYLWSHGLLPQTAYTKAVKACSWNSYTTSCNQAQYYANLTQACMNATNEAYQYVPKVWNRYNIYAPTCHNNSTTDSVGFNPCMENWTPIYMNRPDVLEAIHADTYYNRTWPDHPSNWVYGNQLADVSPLYLNFINQGWKVLVYDGDADTAEPFLEEQQWINCLNRTVIKDWFNWYFNDDIAGSIKIYDGITFQTIKHCGHELPMYCPMKAYQLFYDFLNATYIL